MSVRMDRVTDPDLLAWSPLSQRNSSLTGLADNDVQDYIDQRIDAFRSHPGLVMLGDLERTVFGYGAAQPRAVAYNRTGEAQ